MTDEEDSEFDALRQRLREQPRPSPIEERMMQFVRNHEVSTDLTELRRNVNAGEDLSTIVTQNRNERL